MPELPEVETIRRGISPHVIGKTIARVLLRATKLRWDVPQLELQGLADQKVTAVERRGKYLFLRLGRDSVIFHFGMTGHLQFLGKHAAPGPHDHLDLLFTDGGCLRFRDIRRFGAVLWTDSDPKSHPLVSALGPEPLTDDFTVAHLLQAVGKKPHRSIKETIMDGNVVAGIGNMYASEALFRARIHPAIPAGKLSRRQLQTLIMEIRETLKVALREGDAFISRTDRHNSSPGHFDASLLVYGRNGKPCIRCGKTIKRTTLGGRSTFFCPSCQQEPEEQQTVLK